MLSILIPTYNYDATRLVKTLHKQAIDCNINFEILVFDDGSNSEINIKNETLNKLEHCSFKTLKNNIGRSAIRNLLAKTAQYENLLFLDVDVFPKDYHFIKYYIENLENNLVSGGLLQTKNKPNNSKKLRWLFTKQRERYTLTSANFLIKKKVFKNYAFDLSLKKYGCEDVLFFENLKKNNIHACFINNPVFHLGNEEAPIFIKKTNQALENLIFLIDENKIDKHVFNISKLYFRLKKFKMDYLILFCFNNTKSLLLKNLNSSHPSLFIFDFYRLGYFCSLKTKN